MEDSIPAYEDLRVTTMTHVMSFSTSINKIAAFYCLPWRKVPLQKKRGSRKCKLPHCPIYGSILSINDRALGTRGAIVNSTRPFKNGITIILSTSQKNVNLKLSPDSIQMCGATSNEMAKEGGNYIVEHIQNIKQCQIRIKQEPETASKALQWVKDNTLGAVTPRYSQKIEKYDNVTLAIRTRLKDDNLIVVPEEIPTNIDKQLAEFYLVSCNDLMYHSDLCRHMDRMNTLPFIVDQPLEINNVQLTNVEVAMMNYNYSLGFKVNRFRLNQLIDGRNGFVSRYNNALSTSVTIEKPYAPNNNRVIKRRKNKVPHHTFLVYSSGSVMQSGPGGELMRNVYYEFMTLMQELRPLIEDKD